METRKPDWTPPGQGLSDYARRLLAGEQVPEETMGVLERQARQEITIAYGAGGIIGYGGGSGALGTVACQYCGRFGAYLSSCQGCGAQVRPRATR